MEGNYKDLEIHNFNHLSLLLKEIKCSHSSKYSFLDIFEALCKQESNHKCTEGFESSTNVAAEKTNPCELYTSASCPCSPKVHRYPDISSHVKREVTPLLEDKQQGFDKVLELMGEFYKELLKKYYGVPESERNSSDFQQLLQYQEKYFRSMDAYRKYMNISGLLTLDEKIDVSNSFAITTTSHNGSRDHEVQQDFYNKVVLKKKRIEKSELNNFHPNTVVRKQDLSVSDSILQINTLLLHIGSKHRGVEEKLAEEKHKNKEVIKVLKELENENDRSLLELSSIRTGLKDLASLYGGEGDSLLSRLNNGIIQIVQECNEWKNRCGYLENLISQDQLGEQLFQALELISEKDHQLSQVTTELDKLRDEYAQLTEQFDRVKEENPNPVLANHDLLSPSGTIGDREGSKHDGCHRKDANGKKEKPRIIFRRKPRGLLDLIRNFLRRLIYCRILRRYESELN